jgi:hypothetical protein
MVRQAFSLSKEIQSKHFYSQVVYISIINDSGNVFHLRSMPTIAKVGRTYFPGLISRIDESMEKKIDGSISMDFRAGHKGIKTIAAFQTFEAYLAYQ